MGIVWAILAIGGISVVWTWIGGINSVVWTDMVQFVILFLGAAVALVAVVLVVPGGVPRIVELGQAAGKFRWYDLTFDRTTAFTLWAGLFGGTFLGMGSHGTDQNTCQRLFCCRDEREARKAVLGSAVGLLLAVLMLTVGVGLYAYFTHLPPTPEQAARIAERPDYVFPTFILNAMPVGVKGLLFAAIFSAATATSTLAAMAQGGVALVQEPLRRRGWGEERFVRLSRAFVVVAAAGLCGVAVLLIELRQYRDILNLALAMAGYTYGAMLGILLLALLPLRRDARGLLWGVPYTLLLIVALNWQHVAWVRYVLTGATLLLVAVALPVLRREPLKIAWVLLGAAAVLGAVWVRPPLKLAFPWHYPIGTALTLGLGVALGRKRVATPDAAPLLFGR
jgi:Na+/proline symporter